MKLYQVWYRTPRIGFWQCYRKPRESQPVTTSSPGKADEVAKTIADGGVFSSAVVAIDLPTVEDSVTLATLSNGSTYRPENENPQG